MALCGGNKLEARRYSDSRRIVAVTADAIVTVRVVGPDGRLDRHMPLRDKSDDR
jgi:hypothetical protein